MMNRPPSIVGTIHKNTNDRKLEVTIPTNNLWVSRSSDNDNIEGKWVIDPTVRLPRSFMAFSTQKKRLNNVELSIGWAVMDVDIFVLPTEPESPSRSLWKSKPGYVRIHTSSGNGGRVTLRIHDYIPSDGGENLVRRPLRVSHFHPRRYSDKSLIEIHLPVSFKGIAKIQVDSENITYSKAVKKKSTIVSDNKDTIHLLIGDVSASDLKNPSSLDKIKIKAGDSDKLTLKFDVE